MQRRDAVLNISHRTVAVPSSLPIYYRLHTTGSPRGSYSELNPPELNCAYNTPLLEVLATDVPCVIGRTCAASATKLPLLQSVSTASCLRCILPPLRLASAASCPSCILCLAPLSPLPASHIAIVAPPPMHALTSRMPLIMTISACRSQGDCFGS